MVENTTMRQFGLWESPISPDHLAQKIRFSDVSWDQDGSLVWLEERSGHGVIMIKPPDRSGAYDLNSTISVRAEVGYGGGDFTVGLGNVYFVERKSNRIYKQAITQGIAQPITPEFGKTCSPVLSPDGKWLLFIRSYEGQDTLDIVDADGNNWPQKLVSGSDFYMHPVWHPNGGSIAWIEWDHPNMPWDGTRLCVADLSFQTEKNPEVKNTRILAGGASESIFQPEFSPEGRYLAYVSDRTGWWQIYIYDLVNDLHHQITVEEAEHAVPAWEYGERTYGFSKDGSFIYFLRNQKCSVSLWKLDIQNGREERIDLETSYGYFYQISVSKTDVALIASGGKHPERIITVPISERNQNPVVIQRRSMSDEFSQETYSSPEAIEWIDNEGVKSYGLFYAPQNQRFESTGKPPLIVSVHGGPTSQRLDSFNSQAQFFTSRGYAVLELNYRGSTGFGRDYRNLLNLNWGIYDVQDAINGAQHLVNIGLADRARMVIIGGSAGGFTVLKAMEDHPQFFKAGICLFGVSNMFTMTADTHKFEAHYLETLLGVLPDASEVYRERSPLFFVDRITNPIAIFQGEDDKVVPPDQSDSVVESLRQRGIVHIYHLYPGEGHGFRKSGTIKHFYEEVEKFLKLNVIFS